MLELYHGGHTTCSRKSRLCLKEKGLAYQSHFLNLRGFEQHAPLYLALNPNGVVPTLIDGGEAIVDSMLINEYLDEKYDQHTRLRPDNPLDKARMRVWTKLASDHGLAAVVPRIWPTFKASTDTISPTVLDELLGRIPLQERRERWTKVADGGFGDKDIEDGRKAASLIVTRMEAGIKGPWLMGEQYTLADIDLVPFVDRIVEFYPDVMNAQATPKTIAWLARVKARPNVAAVWATDEAPAKAA